MIKSTYGLSILGSAIRRPATRYSAITTCYRLYSSSSEPENVAILGGGIAGLASAHYLRKAYPNTKITIYEASPRLGGWLHSEKVEVDDGEVVFEKGPRTLRPASNGVLTLRLVSDLGLEDETIFTSKRAPAATNRFIYYPDHLVRLPQPNPNKSLWTNLSALVKSLREEELFQGLVGKLLTEWNVRSRDEHVEDESVGHFFERRLGRDFVHRILSAVFHGIYAGDVYKLSMRSLMPAFFRMERDLGIVVGPMSTLIDGAETTHDEAQFLQLMKKPFPFGTEFATNAKTASVFTFRHGLQQLVDTLKEHLLFQQNIEFLTDTPVKSMDYEKDQVNIWTDQSTTPKAHSQVISTLSPTHLRQILDKPGFVHSGLHKIGYAPTVMTVNLYFRSPGLHPPGFGYLIPLATSVDQNPERALGVVFDTGYSDDIDEADEHITGPPQDTVSQRGTKMTVMFGGHYWDGWSSYPTEEEGLEMALALLKRHLHITEKPAASSVTLARNCIPQYTVGYEDRLRTVHNDLLSQYSGRLKVAGNWMRGVGVNDCIRSAWQVVRDIRDERKTGLETIVQKQALVRLEPKWKVEQREAREKREN